MHSKKMYMAVKAFLYAVIIGMLIFKQTISYMQYRQLVPNLLPFKIMAVYAGLLAITILVIQIEKYIKQKRNGIIQNIPEHVKETKNKGKGRSVIYVGAAAFMIIAFAKNSIQDGAMLYSVSLVNTVKKTGICINSMPVMLAYYGNGLTGISVVNMLSKVIPVCFYILIFALLYLIAFKMTSQSDDYEDVVGRSFLCITVLLMLYADKVDYIILLVMLFVFYIFLISAEQLQNWMLPRCRYDWITEALLAGVMLLTFKEELTQEYDLSNAMMHNRTWICVLAVSLLYLFDRKDRLAKRLTGYCVAIWLISFLLKMDSIISLLAIPVLGYAMAKWWEQAEKKEVRRVQCFFTICFICFMAFGLYGAVQTKRISDVDELIPVECRSIIRRLPDQTETKVLAPDDIMLYIRAESADIDLLYEVYYMNSVHADKYYDAAVCAAHDAMADPKDKLGSIVQIMNGNGCNYLILPLNADERWAMEQSGFLNICETEDYVVYASGSS